MNWWLSRKTQIRYRDERNLMFSLRSGIRLNGKKGFQKTTVYTLDSRVEKRAEK